MYVSTKKACERLGVHPNTLRNWANENKIKYIRTDSGHRRYDVEDYLRRKGHQGQRILYARVSSKKQKDDLARQVRELTSRFPHDEVIEDFGSGLNFRRKGLTALLDRIMSGDVSEVVVAHKDRLCRFGFELIEQIAAKYNCNIVVLNDTNLSPQEELVRDLLSIIHVFSCRLSGLRKYRSQIKEDSNLPQDQDKDEAILGADEILVQQGD